MFVNRFHVTEWLSYATSKPETTFKLEPEQETAMVDAALSYLVTILGIKTYLGMDIINTSTQFHMRTIFLASKLIS